MGRDVTPMSLITIWFLGSWGGLWVNETLGRENPRQVPRGSGLPTAFNEHWDTVLKAGDEGSAWNRNK